MRMRGDFACVVVTLLCCSCGRSGVDEQNVKFIEAQQHELAQKMGMNSPIMMNSIGMEFVLIPAGEYLRGTSDQDAKFLVDNKYVPSMMELDYEIPQHKVRISQPLLFGQTEVTQGQWKAVMKSEPWKRKENVLDDQMCPATYITWKEAQKFVSKLNELENTQSYRLPTDAEWEYAARAGTKGAYHFGADVKKLDLYCWYRKNTFDEGRSFPQNVRQKQPNRFGLYDMHGNVQEWCSNYLDSAEYRQYASSIAVDPQGPEKDTSYQRVIRGGSWKTGPISCRSASRFSSHGSEDDVGFRVVKVP